MKKLLIVPAVIIAMLAGSVANATVEYTLAFSDVDQDTSYMTAIAWMQGNGVIQGYPDGTFQPDTCVNRAEFLKMMYLTLETDIVVEDGFAGSNYYDNFFSDTSTDQWYWPYVEQALRNQTVEGYPDGTFKPANCVNRAEAIKMGISAFDMLSEESLNRGDNVYRDVSVGDNWFDVYIYSGTDAHAIGIDHVTSVAADSMPEVYFHPGESMSRKEVAEMLYRMKTLTDNGVFGYVDTMAPDNLNYYISPSSGVSFLMPEGWWVISDGYYSTAAGSVADYPSIIINGPTAAGEESVAINQRQMDCGTHEFAATCHEINSNYRIGVYDPSLEAMQLMNRINLTFREESKSELAFDGCGVVGNYNEEEWFTNFVGNWDAYLITLDGTSPEHDPIFSQYSEGCLSLDGSQLVFVPHFLINDCPKVFRYDIEADVITQASSDSDYCVWEFGARTGDYITMLTINDYYGCPMQSGQYYYNEDRFVSDLGDCSPTDGWETFSNTTYKYEFKHPADLEVMSNSYAKAPNEASMISINNVEFNMQLVVDEDWEGSGYDFIYYDLEDYVNEVWQANLDDDNLNIQNKEVGELKHFTFNGFDAYSFTLTGSYQDERGGYVLNEETLYTFMLVGDTKVIYWFPTDYSDGYLIMESTTFLQ